MSEDLDRRMGEAAGVGALLARARFEVVPLSSADAEVGHLPVGSTVTVTSSPRRGLDGTVDLAERLAARGFRAVPHLSARLVRGEGHLEEVVGRLRAAAVEEVFVVGGDPPEPIGPFRSALEVMEVLAGGPFSRMGVAGYPERHPFIGHEDLLEALADKEPLASYVVTQICFDPQAVIRWLGEIRRRGISLPVYLGVPGAVVRRKLLEVALRIGVGDSIRYLAKHGNLVARLVRRGGYRPDAFLAGMSSHLAQGGHGVAGFHINTFNQVRTTERWRQRTMAAYRLSAAPQDQAGA